MSFNKNTDFGRMPEGKYEVYGNERVSQTVCTQLLPYVYELVRDLTRASAV
jgi:hypothetical protein